MQFSPISSRAFLNSNTFDRAERIDAGKKGPRPPSIGRKIGYIMDRRHMEISDINTGTLSVNDCWLVCVLWVTSGASEGRVVITAWQGVSSSSAPLPVGCDSDSQTYSVTVIKPCPFSLSLFPPSHTPPLIQLWSPCTANWPAVKGKKAKNH